MNIFSINQTRVVRYLAILSFFLFFFISFLSIQIIDSDFWWHLASGKYIVENHSLPESDPFNYTTENKPSDRQMYLLSGYWLSQVIFYKLFDIWGAKGIILLRSLLLVLFLFFIFLTIRKQRVSDLTALIITSMCFLTAKNYIGERPVLFTFFTFSVVVYLLEDFRMNRGRKAFLLIPLAVMVLSNMHLGYVICIMLSALYLAGEGVRLFLGNEKRKDLLKGFLAIFVITGILSLFNPNGGVMLTGIFSFHDEVIQDISEFIPTFVLYQNKIVPMDYAYIISLVFSLLSLRYLKKMEFIHMLLIAAFTAMSFFAVRYVIFYMCISSYVIARIIANLKEEKILNRLVERLKDKEGIVYIVTLIFGVFLVFQAIPALARFEFKAETSHYVPEGAADFLSDHAINGNMLNEDGFGGYLIWRLYPGKKVFIDTRKMELDVFNEYRALVNLWEGPPQSWMDIIIKYNITHIVTSPLMLTGDIYPLVEYLFDSKEWILVYADHLSLIYVSNNSENTSVIRQFTRDKNEGLKTIIVQASAQAMQNPKNPYYLISLGKVFLKMGRLNDAEKAFKMAYERDSGNTELKYWTQQLEKYKKYKVKGR
ncbi:MAG: hypothetical protein AB1638_05870 [Nitrospirota bacterium]